LIRLAGEAPETGTPGISETVGWVLSYSPEYSQLQADPDALVRLALAANGRIAISDPTDAFAHTLPVPGSSRPTWPWLLLAAILLLPVDIAVRRLVITRRDWQILAERWQTAFPRRPPLQPASREQRMQGLLSAKQRASTREPTPGVQKTREGLLKDTPQPVIIPSKPSIQRSAPPDVAQPAGETRPEQTGVPSPESTASALLKKKRQRRNDDG
jgi:hypothetical protein